MSNNKPSLATLSLNGFGRILKFAVPFTAGLAAGSLSAFAPVALPIAALIAGRRIMLTVFKKQGAFTLEQEYGFNKELNGPLLGATPFGSVIEDYFCFFGLGALGALNSLMLPYVGSSIAILVLAWLFGIAWSVYKEMQEEKSSS